MVLALNSTMRVVKSKTDAGERVIPMNQKAYGQAQNGRLRHKSPHKSGD